MLKVSLPIAPFLREAQLTEIWAGQQFPKEALITRAGQRLRVLYRGRRGGGPGPDFRDALIALPQTLVYGDIELHVRSSDFRRHGHHLDPAYSQVALHVVLWGDGPGDTALLAGGLAPVLELGPWLVGAKGVVRGEASQVFWEEPCRTAGPRLGAAQVARTLDRLGEMRLRQKTAAIRRELDATDAEQSLYRAILEVLGYSRNREMFRLIADQLPWAALRHSLLAAPVRQRALLAEALLKEAAQDLSLRWRTDGQRPNNHPQRRLRGAAALAARWAEPGLMSLLALLAEAEPGHFIAAFSAPPHVGKGRAVEIMVNAFLPFALAWAQVCVLPDLAIQAEEAFRRLPRAAAYGSTRHLDDALAGLDGVRIDVRKQQGFLYLLRQYCSQGGCGSCPLS